MGRRTEKASKSQTLPSSPTHSASSSDFEFTISLSPRKSSTTLCPADELFYKGQLLPLHLSPRLSMVRTLLLASSSTSSSSDTTTTASRDSTGSSNDSHSSFSADLLLADCDSSRPSSVAEEDEFKRLNNHHRTTHINPQNIKKTKYFSLSRFSVFRKESKNRQDPENLSASSVKRMSSTAKEVIRKYMKKVKPLYEKLSQKQQQKMATTRIVSSEKVSLCMKPDGSVKEKDQSVQIQNAKKGNNSTFSHSFSGNLRYPRRRGYVSSCPSSMRSSPSHSGILCSTGVTGASTSRVGGMCSSDASSMEELQSAIQGAIAHCKNSMLQNKSMVSNEI
ncbi:unnamed protein product [Ilex paraguariensis]|uniref:Membrane-associated kinase regulator 1 n=1 Tax=Ilex paraguariensis TaxID=185542 RepID=A0ABC8RG46_9AQUA